MFESFSQKRALETLKKTALNLISEKGESNARRSANWGAHAPGHANIFWAANVVLSRSLNAL